MLISEVWEVCVHKKVSHLFTVLRRSSILGLLVLSTPLRLTKSLLEDNLEIHDLWNTSWTNSTNNIRSLQKKNGARTHELSGRQGFTEVALTRFLGIF